MARTWMAEMRVAVMQPYFMPYIGYFQLIASVDKFVIYDNIKYTKKGWINRNRLLLNGAPSTFSLPLSADSDSAQVRERTLALAFDRARLLNQVKGAYARAPYFGDVFPIVEQIVGRSCSNLFEYIYRAVSQIATHLGVATPIVISSTIPIDHDLKGQDKVLAICHALGANQYVNAIGGMELYAKEDFSRHGIELNFIKTKPIEYQQFPAQASFVPNLSIIDVLMFNPLDRVKQIVLNDFELI